jgi:hypothetical protein
VTTTTNHSFNPVGLAAGKAANLTIVFPKTNLGISFHPKGKGQKQNPGNPKLQPKIARETHGTQQKAPRAVPAREQATA